MRFVQVSMCGLLAGSLMACNGGPSDEDYDDVAASVGALTASDSGGDVQAMDDAVAASQGEEPDGLTRSGEGSLSGQRFGLDWEYELTCSSAAGEVQAACDESTDVAHLVLAWNGSIDVPRWSASIARSGDWTLSNLQSDIAQLDGQGSIDVDSDFQALYRDVRKTLHLEYDAEWTAVQLSKSLRRPVGGSAQFDVHVERTSHRGARDAEAQFDIEAIVTFQPDGTASLVLDGQRHYTVDLEAGTVQPQD